MNSLDAFAAGFSAEERQSLFTWCVSHNLVSDNCTGLHDVWEGDARPVVERLKAMNAAHFRNVLKYSAAKE